MPDNQKNSGNHSGPLSKIRKIFGLNIGTMLFGCLLIYMLFSAVLYLTSTNIESYLVISGPLSRNETYTGLALREESVHQAETGGYMSYYAREGSKINANGVVYGISSSQPSESTAELSVEQLSQIRSNMLSFSKGFNPSNFNNTYSFKYELEGDILQYAQAPGSGSNADSSSDEDSEDEESESSTSAASTVSYAGQTLDKAETDGVVLYSVDGYEGKTLKDLTAQDFDQNAYQEIDLKNQGSVNAGDDMYTLITDERWSLLIPLSGKQAAKLKDRTSVRVKFLKDGMTQSGDFSIVEIDKAKYGKIDFNKGLIRYAADRFLEIELVTNTVTGLKIPLSSVVTKEFYKLPSAYLTTNDDQESGVMIQHTDKNGSSSQTFVKATVYGEDTVESEDGEESGKIYYIDMSNFKEGDVAVNPKDQSKYVLKEVGVLEGTYCINQGYAIFRRIEIRDQNEEYAIVSKETRYGLSRYDHIVKNADKVDEQEILY